MKSDHARAIIEKKRRCYLLYSVIFLLGGIPFTILTLPSIYNQLLGPFEKNASDLITMSDQVGSYELLPETWVTLDIDTSYPNLMISSDNQEKDDNALFVTIAQIDDYFVIVQSNSIEAISELQAGNITGKLIDTGIDTYQDYYRELETEFRQQYPDVDFEIFPVGLNLSESPIGITLFGVLVCIPITILGCIALWYGLQLTSNPNNSAIMQRLAHYGDPEEILEQIEHEMKYKRIPNTSSKSYCFTQNWFIYTSMYEFIAVRYDDIIWVRQGKYTLDGQKIIIYDRYGSKFNIGIPNDWIKRMLRHKTPWSAWDKSKEIQQFWKRNRKEFINNVDEIRRSMTNSKKNK